MSNPSERPALQVCSVKESDFVYGKAGNLLDPSNDENNTMYGALALNVPGMMAGKARMIKGENRGKDWTYYYNEIIYVTHGRALITAAAPPAWHTSEQHEVGPGDFFYAEPGLRISMEPLSDDEPFEFFYAIPMPPVLQKANMG